MCLKFGGNLSYLTITLGCSLSLVHTSNHINFSIYTVCLIVVDGNGGDTSSIELAVLAALLTISLIGLIIFVILIVYCIVQRRNARQRCVLLRMSHSKYITNYKAGCMYNALLLAVPF